MDAPPENANGLAEFAEAHGLEPVETSSIDSGDGLLGRASLEVGAAVAGTLPGGEPGTLAHLTYTYRSDDATHTRRLTAAIVAVPESIGFAPLLTDRNGRDRSGMVLGVDSVELTEDVSVWAREGIDSAWLRELFSPALTDWLARSPDGFGWELRDGRLVASAEGHVTGEADLERLCEDGSHLAAAIRAECLEEVDSGTAAETAARAKPNPEQLMIEQILALASFDEPPANVTAAAPVFRALVLRHPSTYLLTAWLTFVFALAVNIIGGGIFGLLLNVGNTLLAVAVFEVIVFTVVGYFVFRGQVSSRTAKAAEEAFWREYARARGLKLIEPATFAATHAKASLPGTPMRVLEGALRGVPGALMITGDGLKRGDRVALVAGPAGPTASADYALSAPGATIVALDEYGARLAAEIRARR